MPNAGDPGTARLVDNAGFKAIGTSSAAAALALGVRDGEVDRDQMLCNIAAICEATSLPVSADLGNGFGISPSTVAETIALAAEAGAVGGSIEDFTGDRADPIYDRTLAIERVRAAVEAAKRLSFPFVLTARTDSFLVGVNDLAEVIARLSAFRESGADVLYAPALPDEGALREALAVAGDCPLNVLAQGSGIASDITRLRELGVRRISLGSGLARIAYTSVASSIEAVASGDFTTLRSAMSLSEANRLFDGTFRTK